MHSRLSRCSLVLCSLLLLTLGCAQAQATADEDFVLQEAAYLSQHYVPPAIQWSPCPQAVSHECGTLALPIDYRAPLNGSFNMALVRVKASQPAQRMGTLVLSYGGPTRGSAVEGTLALLNQPHYLRLRSRFDLVSFDARGTGNSRPVQCDVVPVGRPADTASNDSLIAYFDDFGRRLAEACVKQNGPFLTSVSTNNVARDLDVLRRALGERQISFYGPSYSSMVGAVYASLFPRQVRAMVLDGVRAPETRDYVRETISETLASSEMALHRVDQLCRASATCLLRNAGVVATMDKVLARLRAAPVVFADRRVLDAPQWQSLIDSALVNENRWPDVVQGLTAAAAERFEVFQALLPAAGTVVTGGLDSAHNPLKASRFEAFAAVSCLDYGSRGSAASYLPYDEAFASLHRRLVERYNVAAVTAMCSSWPAVDAPIITRLAGRVPHPVLLIATQFDNRTPLSWARSMARTLGMERSLIRYEGGSHSAYFPHSGPRIACIDNAVEAYLFELRVPAEGFACAARPVLF
jgi:pimeloyl-ACP methyl ester carboxylesterase